MRELIFGRTLEVMRRLAAGLLVAVIAAGAGSGDALADRGFDTWVRDFWPQAHSAGISRAVYQRAFAGVTLDREVVNKTDRQAEFVKPVWEYLNSAVSDKRLVNGRAMLDEHARLLDRIEAKYGVDRHVVVAIWGMESSYGAVLDNPKIVRNVIQSLASLAYAGGRYQRFGRTQLIAALKILQRGDISADGLTGSWAGAMGHTQFIPATYNGYAVDFDGDGRRDIWNSIADALGSTAAYLNRFGWVSGKTWGYEVSLPEGFDYSLADGRSERSLGKWAALGVRRAKGSAFPRPEDDAWLLLPAGAGGAAFLMLKNFSVIKRYNNADAYALAVGHLADRLRGGEAFVADWPESERPLTSDQTKLLQEVLSRRGYPVGAIDGKLGPNTRAAIRKFQRSVGLTPDGYPSTGLLGRARGDS
ncbi:lytic murein transglycosylase [Breoghania sp. L-A4]|uniref:lytic murein transglycosylase n=1 Tax=Breoghania sp. L-A4 TaxID=2304600 RepID=UPI000E3606F2|nr:lytic murein transglycosylase [Breoghania sp. L-A4]AXS41872.1 lytic murein transglycosylase [Breoghania sp. L-A4]